MSTEETEQGVTVDLLVRSLTGRTLAEVAALASVPKVADAATVDRRKKSQERRSTMDR